MIHGLFLLTAGLGFDVIVNDGSTEPVPLRCLSDIQKIYPAVRVIRQEMAVCLLRAILVWSMCVESTLKAALNF